MQRFEEVPFRIDAGNRAEGAPEKSASAAVENRTKIKRLKILIVAPTLDVFLGGQAIQAARLAEKLNQEPNISADIQSIGPKFLPRLQRIKYLRTLLRGVKFLFDIVTKIPSYDIIHIFSAAHFSFLLTPTPAVLVAKLFGKKTVLNYRSGQIDEHFAVWERSLRPTLKLFDKIVVPSGYLVDEFAKYEFEAEAVHNFVNLERFHFRERRALRPVFLSNRLLEELYNIPCILRAFAVIQEKYPQARLVVASFGDRRAMLEDLARELKLENVEFVGKIEQEKMPDLYDEIDIYLNSPNTDNMPGSLIECYASGVPVVTTNAGGIPYILEHEKTGLMVAVNDHEALARQALRLLEDQNLADEIVKNGREYCRMFTWERVRADWLKVYGELAPETVDKHSA